MAHDTDSQIILFLKANSEGTDRTAWMRRLAVCAFVGRMEQKQ